MQVVENKQAVLAHPKAIAARQAKTPGCRTAVQRAVAILEAAVMRDKRMNKIVRMRQERRHDK